MSAGRGSPSAWAFFGMVMALSLPFYALAATKLALPFAPSFPVSAVMVVVPLAAAFLLVYRQGGHLATARFLRLATDARCLRQTTWVLAAIFIMPIAFALTAGALWLLGDAGPALQLAPLGLILAGFVLIILGAACEEIGWQGYAWPGLKRRHSALQAALIIGAVWALWHVIPFALVGRNAGWILWHSLAMVLMRVIIAWLFVNTAGGMPVAVLFHAMSNAVWVIFTDYAVHYDPLILCLLLLCPVGLILRFWGTHTLAQFRR